MIAFSGKFLTKIGLLAFLFVPQVYVAKSRVSEDNLIYDAWCKIQKALHDTYHPKEGSLVHISCVYKLHKNTKVQEEVKKYFDGYHTKKHYASEMFNDKENPDTIVKIDYKPNSDHLSLAYKDPKRHNRLIDEKEIKISKISSNYKI